jgi:hypothetical protein
MTGVYLYTYFGNIGGSVAASDERSTFFFVSTGLTDTEAAYLSWCVNAWATAFGSNTYVNP